MAIAFDEKELNVKCVLSGGGRRIDMPVFDSPISPKENCERYIKGEPTEFMPNYRYYKSFTPRCVPDNEARGFVMDGGKPVRHPEGFPDMFGINWIFVEVAGGAMVQPGSPMLEDMDEWEEKLVWPDPLSWDWEGQRKISEEFIKTNPQLPLVPTIMNGYFERMISMLDFENAAMALIDEEQEESVRKFLDKIADLYITMIDKYVETFPEIAGFCIHDDWGSQRAPFFSLDTAMDMLVPPMKRVADHIHSTGRFYDMHCCGMVEQLIPAMIAIGVDSWSGQVMNDKAKLYHQYGKDILIGVETPEIPADMPEEEIAKIAKAYVDEFYTIEKPGMIGFNSPIKNDAFFKYAYQYSREKAAQ